MPALLLTKAITACCASAALPALQLSWLNPPVQLWLQRFASGQPQQHVTAQQSTPKYKGVVKVGSKWRVNIRIPKNFVQGRDTGFLQHICVAASVEEAAAISDVYQLALHRDNVKPRHLNFPASKYSSEQVAAAGQMLQKKCPGLNTLLAPNRKPRLHPPMVDRSPVLKLAAQIAETAAAHLDHSTALVGVHQPTNRPDFGVDCGVDTRRFGGYRLRPFTTAVEAAIVYDLVRINLYGIEYTVNFPPHIYTDSDVAVVRQDMKHRYPDIFATAVKVAARHPPSTYSLLMAAKDFDTAVKATLPIPAVATRAYIGNKHGSKGVYAMCSKFMLEIDEKIAPGRSIRHTRCFDSHSEASAAYDMACQALGREAVNLPASVTAAGVPAARVWLQCNRLRKTYQKQQWAARAAALEAVQHAADGQANRGGSMIADQQQ